jgi:hypothetical protein
LPEAIEHPVLHLVGSLVCKGDGKDMPEIIGFSQYQPEVFLHQCESLP